MSRPLLGRHNDRRQSLPHLFSKRQILSQQPPLLHGRRLLFKEMHPCQRILGQRVSDHLRICAIVPHRLVVRPIGVSMALQGPHQEPQRQGQQEEQLPAIMQRGQTPPRHLPLMASTMAQTVIKQMAPCEIVQPISRLPPQSKSMHCERERHG